MFKYLIILGILAFAQVARSGSNCDDNSKLQYETGKSYVYKLQLDAYDARKHDFINLQKRSGRYGPQTSGRISTSGQVVLTALENCQFVLTLQNVYAQIHGIRRTEQLTTVANNRKVPRTSMMFTFRNGEVSEIFKKDDSNSTVWTENIIRGILTMIQNKGLGNAEGEQEEKETNIRGQCISRVFIPSEGVYSKTMQTLKCSQPVITPSGGVEYVSSTFPIQAPHMKHSHGFTKCQINVTNGLLASSSCNEFNEIGHIKAFRHREDMTSSLTLEQSGKDVESVGGAITEEIATLSQKSSIVYDPNHSFSDESSDKSVNEGILSLVKQMYEDKDANKAELFLKLKERVLLVRCFDSLEDTLTSASSNGVKIQFMQNIVRAAAAEAGTEPAVLYLSGLIHEDKLGRHEQKVFYTRLHRSHDATFEGLKALRVLVADSLDDFMNASLIDQFDVLKSHEKKKMYRMQLLGVSAYAYLFCQKNLNCGTLPHYQQLIFKIAQFSSSQQPDLAPAALQAVGNVGHLPESVIDIIKVILKSEISVLPGSTAKFLAALEAFRRDPCEPSLKELTRGILKDEEYVRSIRISAYMAATRCFDAKDLKLVETILQSEPKSYLSSYIASHFHNIMDSQSPSKTMQKVDYFSRIEVPKSVPTTHNKPLATKYVEYSNYNPDYNVGFSAEAGIVFPKEVEGFTPQSVVLNFTVDLFGKSYNTLQIGLSRELVPNVDHGHLERVAKLLSVPYNSKSAKIIPYFVSADSYYRIHGTTVCVGSDLADVVSHHKFMDTYENPENGEARFDIVKAFTLHDHEFKMPTISGLPLSLTSQIAYLPMIMANHTGNMDSVGFIDLITRFDELIGGVFAHNSTSDSTFVAGVDIAVGKNTPVHMGYHAMAKIHLNHSIGYESVKQENGWIKTVKLPEMVVASARLTAVRQFFMELDGKEHAKWNMFGGSEPTEPETLFKWGGMGLQLSGQILSSPKPMKEAPFDAILKVEKTEEEFEGYGLTIEMQDGDQQSRKLGIKAQANGLSTQDTIFISINYTDINVFDLEKDEDIPTFKMDVKTDISQKDVPSNGFKFKYESIGLKKSEYPKTPEADPESEAAGILSIPTFGLMTRKDYSLQLKSIDHGEDVKLFDWTIKNNKYDGDVSMEFYGPLKSTLGDIHLNFFLDPVGPKKREGMWHHFHCLEDKEWKAELSHESEELGNKRFVIAYSFDSGEIWLNTTTEVLGITHDVTHHLIPSRHLTRDEYGKVTEKHYKTEYFIDYKDSQGKTGSLSGEGNKLVRHLENDQTTLSKNLTVKVTHTDMKEPLLLEAIYMHEKDNTHEIVNSGMKQRTFNIYLNAFGKKQAELTWDQKNTDIGVDDLYLDCPVGGKLWNEKNGKPYRCATTTIVAGLVIADHIEYLSSFTNERRLGFTKNIKAYHNPSQTRFNLTYELDFPKERDNLGIVTKLHVLKQNEDKFGWNLASNSDLDLENRTIEWSSVVNKLEKEGDSVLVKSTGNGHLADSWNGESFLKIHHECAHNGVTNIDLTNVASLSGNHYDTALFSNKFSVLYDHQGTTKMLLPKKHFTWNYISNGQLTDEQKKKFDSYRKIKSEIKYEVLTEPKRQENFHYTNEYDFFKILDKEKWAIKDGHYSVLVEGEEKSGGLYHLVLNIIPERDQENRAIATNLVHAPSHDAHKDDKLSTEVYVDFNINGWIEQDFPSKQNNTFMYSSNFQMFPFNRKITTRDIFEMKKTEIKDGSETFSIRVEVDKQACFKDWLHFYTYERAIVNVDNKTMSFNKNIDVNGPNFMVFIESKDGTKSGSWLINVVGGVKEENHQHKFNLRSKSGSFAQIERLNDPSHQNHMHILPVGDNENHKLHSHHHRHQFNFHQSYSVIPYTNFNITISR